MSQGSVPLGSVVVLLHHQMRRENGSGCPACPLHWLWIKLLKRTISSTGQASRLFELREARGLLLRTGLSDSWNATMSQLPPEAV